MDHAQILLANLFMPAEENLALNPPRALGNWEFENKLENEFCVEAWTWTEVDDIDILNNFSSPFFLLLFFVWTDENIIHFRSKFLSEKKGISLRKKPAASNLRY